MTLSVLLMPPLLASCLAILVRPYQRFVGWVSVIGASLSFAASIALCTTVVAAGPLQDAASATTLWRAGPASPPPAPRVSFSPPVVSLPAHRRGRPARGVAPPPLPPLS